MVFGRNEFSNASKTKKILSKGCIVWLNQKLVLLRVNPLNVQKTQFCTVEIQFGVEKQKNHATLQTAHIQCA